MKIIYIYAVDPTGASFSIPVEDATLGKRIPLPEIVSLQPLEGSPQVMSNNFSIGFAADLPAGQVVSFVWQGGFFTLDGTHTFEVWGVSLTQDQLNVNGSLTFTTVDESGTLNTIYTPNFAEPTSISGESIVIDSIPADRLQAGADGDVFTTEGSEVVSQKLADKNIAADAGIQWDKLEAKGAEKVVITGDDGLQTVLNFLDLNRGGLGLNAVAQIGFIEFDGEGGSRIGRWEDTKDQCVSFEVDEQGEYNFYFNSPVVITEAFASVVKTIAGTDEGQLSFYNDFNALMDGSNISSGFLSIPAGSAVGEVITTSLTVNNTVTTGNNVKVVSNKTTAGGNVNVTLLYYRVKLGQSS